MNVWFKAIGIKARIMFGRAFRETGQKLDQVGSNLTNDIAYLEHHSRHRTMMPLNEFWPSAGKSFIAPNASVVGEVLIGNGSSIWYNATIRADQHAIRIGDNVSIGENSSLFVHNMLNDGLSCGVNINDNVVVGPNTTIHAATVDSYVRIGAGVTIQPGARIERGAIVLDGANVGPNQQIPALTVWGGNPARQVREATPEDYKQHIHEAIKDQAAQGAANKSYLANLNIR